MSNLSAIMSTLARQAVLAAPRQRPPAWSREELAFLYQNAGILDDEQIGQALRRTPTAVKVCRVRQGLRTITKAGKVWITANQAARLLQLDAHKVVYWCRDGLISANLRLHEASGREYYIIKREMLKRWCVNPNNWVYFDWRKITDRHIHRLCELRAERWSDEWWTTRQVAEYHGVDVDDVKRLIARGEIKSCRPAYSLGGRDFGNNWRNHFVLKSEATRPNLVFLKGRGRPRISKKFSHAFDAFLLRARNELNLEFPVIARMMKANTKSISYRYARLKKETPCQKKP